MRQSQVPKKTYHSTGEQRESWFDLNAPIEMSIRSPTLTTYLLTISWVPLSMNISWTFQAKSKTNIAFGCTT